MAETVMPAEVRAAKADIMSAIQALEIALPPKTILDLMRLKGHRDRDTQRAFQWGLSSGELRVDEQMNFAISRGGA